MVEVDLAVQDLLESMPQYSTLLKGKDLANIAGRGVGNRSSQEGGIFGGGCYAADAQREALTSNKRAAVSNPIVPPAEAPPPAFSKPVNNASSIQGGIFGGEEPAGPGSPPGKQRSNRSNQSSVEGGIFGSAYEVRAPPSRNGRNPNQSSIEGGIFG